MNTRLLSMVRKHYTKGYMEESTRRHYMRQWAKCIRKLDNRWVLSLAKKEDEVSG